MRRITLQIDDNLRRAVRTKAVKEERSIKAVVTALLEKWIEQPPKEKVNG